MSAMPRRLAVVCASTAPLPAAVLTFGLAASKQSPRLAAEAPPPGRPCASLASGTTPTAARQQRRGSHTPSVGKA